MIYAGCDLGTVTAKAVIIDDDDAILAVEILPYKNLPRQAAVEALEKALARAGMARDQASFCLSTGFGKKAVPYSDGDVPEIIALNRAVRKLNPGVKTVIDAGGQGIKAFNIDNNGKVGASTANEKCAAGTGKFMEVMAGALEMPVEELSRVSLDSHNPLAITSQCGVFAESEVITHVNEGKDRMDIFAGIALSVAGKLAGVIRRISVVEEVAMVGGVAKNKIVVRDFQKELGLPLAELNLDPQAVGAYGAALLARERNTRGG